MDTPKRGLVRVTERAIKEYINEGCEENLPLIKRLEDVAYELWVESNTAFIDETLMVSEADDDGWIWEDDLFQSFYNNAHDLMKNDKGTISCRPEEADDTSSICSPTKPLDNSPGYVTSCDEDKGVYSFSDKLVHRIESCRLLENVLAEDKTELRNTTDIFEYNDDVFCSDTRGTMDTSCTSDISERTSDTSGINDISRTSDISGTVGTSCTIDTSGIGDTSGTNDTSCTSNTSCTGDISVISDTSGINDIQVTGDTTGTSDTSGINDISCSGNTSGTNDTRKTSDTSGINDISCLGDTSGTDDILGTSDTSGYNDISGSSDKSDIGVISGTSGTTNIHSENTEDRNSDDKQLLKVDTVKEQADNEDLNTEGADTFDISHDDWVLVNGDCIGHVSSDWFIISTSTSNTSSRSRSGHNELQEKDNQHLKKDNTSDSIDLSDWAVLSMKITERTNDNDTDRCKLKLNKSAGTKSRDYRISSTTRAGPFHNQDISKLLSSNQDTRGLVFHDAGDVPSISSSDGSEISVIYLFINVNK